ncbi:MULTISPECIES: exo 1,3/1,4-beta-D-glucan glucohydrolase [Microbulbifer]|uniref:glycoside hydrolase family 3 protein n=1 Tax=Microbulbifer TaxID=48073 RepID=UPI001E61F5C4|nr:MULTISPECIES: glycoside hydrolase family 3 N-terminal domain-containing protein [Microbulbifer]UHQ53745.1 glycoside hydrolase family 3 C-terminal domain-containing protein [Microbulbifer sp. YPW16]
MSFSRQMGTGLLLCSAILAGCGERAATSEAKPETSSAAQVEASGGDISVWPKLEPALPKDPAVEKRIDELMAQMSLEEKVGQLIQPEIKYVTPEDVKKYHLGSILNGGGSYPHNNKLATPQEWHALSEAFYEASMDTSDGGTAIPIIWGSDAVHGHNNVMGATLFPHNIGLGAARDPDLIRRIGEATAREVAVTGIDWTFSPTVAVVRDDRWGRTYESYSEDPAVVKAYAEAMVKGTQGEKNSEEFLGGEKLVATAKHWIGDGGTQRGIDRGDNQVPEKELAEVHAAGYFGALPAGVQAVMASFNSWNGERLHGHKYLLTDVLKERLGFDGFVVGDWNGHKFVPGCTVDSCAAAINAGLDMFMVPSDWKELYKNTLAQAQSGEIPAERLDDAVRRILRVKVRAGLFEHNRPLAGKEDIVGNDEHRALAREAVRKSLVLLKNNDQLLPLKPTQNILVAGDGADNLAKQSGGWTITWQGTGTTREDFPGATSIFEGIEQAVKGAGGEAVLSEQGEFAADSFANGEKPDVAIVVFGENPYAEWHGDLSSLEYQVATKADLALLKKLKSQGIPVVSVFLSGRVLWVNKEMNASDAFVAAWLPGSEGAGVADVLFTDAEGNVRYDFTGTLPFSWPEQVHQTVLNPYHKEYAPLFKLGYGLRAGQESLVSNELTEDGQTYADGALEDAWMLVSRPRSPWQLQITEAGQAPVTVAGNRAASGDDENITVASIDMESQEDARRIQWKGLRPGSVQLAAEQPQDLSRYLKEGAALTLDIRVDSKPEQPVNAVIACGDDCTAELPLQNALQALQPGEWQKLSIDLQCFVDKGADFSRVSNAVALRSEGALELAVANIKYVPNKAGDAVIRCQG